MPGLTQSEREEAANHAADLDRAARFLRRYSDPRTWSANRRPTLEEAVNVVSGLIILHESKTIGSVDAYQVLANAYDFLQNARARIALDRQVKAT